MIYIYSGVENYLNRFFSDKNIKLLKNGMWMKGIHKY